MEVLEWKCSGHGECLQMIAPFVDKKKVSQGFLFTCFWIQLAHALHDGEWSSERKNTNNAALGLLSVSTSVVT